MKRRNIYIASTLVLALVLMVGFPTSARPQIHVKVKTPNLYVNIIPSITKIQQMVERVEKGIKIPNFAVPQPNMNSVASRTHILQLPEAPCPKPAKTAKPVKASPLLKVAPTPALLAAKAAKEKKRRKTIETIISRFTTYAAINTQPWDSYDPTEFPITLDQEKLAELIEEELRNIGADKDLIVNRSEYQYVYATIPANCEGVPSIMFMAHMDITPECVGEDITPIVHRNYDGGDFLVPAGITLSPQTPQGKHLANCVGKTIITSDGSTLLGADDKTGCTILVTLIETILKDKKLKHGDLHFVFSQNEDIGRAADRFEKEYVDGQPDIVIDVDGDDPTAFSVENFTAVGRNYTFHGKNAHPGNGFYNQYGDALTAASYFIGQLPPETHPSASKGKEGYIHCYSVSPLVDVDADDTQQEYLV